MTLSGLDLRVLVHELEQQIVGSWIVNIYHIPHNIFIFKIRKPQSGLFFLLIEPGKRIHLTNFNRTMPKEPSNFCKTLRSHLRDRRINSISQRFLDRIAILNIGPDEGYTLIIELFGKGNVILVSPQNKIISAITYRKMRDRDIHPGREFVQIPSNITDILRNKGQGLKEQLNENEKIVPMLNNWIGLGPAYSRFVLRECGIKKKLTNQLNDTEIQKIENFAIDLFNTIESVNYEPIVYLEAETDSKTDSFDDIKDNDLVESTYDLQWDDEALPFKPEQVIKILPIPDPRYDNDEGIIQFHPESLNKALDVFYSSQESVDNIETESEELETETERLERLLQQQKDHQSNLLNNAEICRRQADALYANFQPGSEILSTVYEARRKNMEWDEIESKLILGKEKQIDSALLFDKLKIKEAKITLKLPLKNEVVTSSLDFRKSLQENANELYAKAKKSERKAEGANIAIKRTIEKINLSKNAVFEKRDEIVNKVPILKRRKPWYEKFHWTMSESNFLIISGYDATTNERLVKRYFDDDDIFFHADVQGAAATIIKSNGRDVPENVMKLAAQMAASYSALWRSGRPSGDVYYVFKEQVSMSAKSGEFLPKGSFMIYGTKSYIRDVKLELILGLIIKKNWVRVDTTFKDIPIDFVFWVKIGPGTQQRGSLAKQIKQKFIKLVDDKDRSKVKALNLADIAFMLPGNSRILEWSNP